MNLMIKYILLFLTLVVASCSESNNNAKKEIQSVQNIEGYVSLFKDNWTFYDCSNDALYSIKNDAVFSNFINEIDKSEVQSHWFYTAISAIITSNKSGNELTIHTYTSPVLNKFCDNETMLVSGDYRFLGAGKGVHIYDIGAKYGPLIGSKSDGKGGFYPDQFEMHTKKSSFLANFFTDDEKNVQNIELRSSLIKMPQGIRTGMILQDVLSILPCLELDRNRSLYGMTVLKCKEMSVEFVFTEDYAKENESIGQIPLDSRLYLIRL